MTEAEWLACDDPRALSSVAIERFTKRKFRLYACAVCRHYGSNIPNPAFQAAIRTGEAFADGLVDDVERMKCAGYLRFPVRSVHRSLRWLYDYAEWAVLDDGDIYRGLRLTALASSGGNGRTRRLNAPWHSQLLKHLTGNPFRPMPQGPWSSSMIALAEAGHSSQDCSFALHDALLEAGHSELAEHFRTKDHPKGCFAVDLILGKS